MPDDVEVGQPQDAEKPRGRPGRPPGRQNNATIDSRAFYRPMAKRLAKTKVKAAERILRHFIAGEKTTDAELRFAADVCRHIEDHAHGKPPQRQELTGADGGPLAHRDDSPPHDRRELSKRIVALLGNSDAGSVAPANAGTPRPATSAPVEAPGHSNSVAPGAAFSGGYSDGGGLSGGSDPHAASLRDIRTVSDNNVSKSENGASSQNCREPESPEPKPDPEKISPSEFALVAGFEIRCTESPRPGVPDLYSIHDGRGALLRGGMGDFSKAVAWCREKGGDADAPIEVFKKSVKGEPLRHEDLAIPRPQFPKVINSRNRKGI